MSAIQSLSPSLAPHWVPLCVSRLHYHVTWTSRGRIPVFTGRRAKVASEMLRRLAGERGVQLEAISVRPDRVHLILSLRPNDRVASVVRELRGRSALSLLQELPELRVALGGNLLWSETYGIATVSPGKLAARVARLSRPVAPSPEGGESQAACSRS